MTDFRLGKLWQDSLKELPQNLMLRWFSEMQPQLLANPGAGEPLGAGLRIYTDDESPLRVTYQFDEKGDVIVLIDISERHVQINRIVFISYSHEDKAWLDTIYEGYLKVLEDAGDIDFWRDDDLRASQRWEQEIEKALRDATAAILLVSQSFLDSKFIGKSELPVILGKSDGDGVTFSWIAIRKVEGGDDPNWQEIHQVQALGDPQVPLEELGDPARRTVELMDMLLRIQREVSDLLRNPSERV